MSFSLFVIVLIAFSFIVIKLQQNLNRKLQKNKYDKTKVIPTKIFYPKKINNKVKEPKIEVIERQIKITEHKIEVIEPRRSEKESIEKIAKSDCIEEKSTVIPVKPILQVKEVSKPSLSVKDKPKIQKTKNKIQRTPISRSDEETYREAEKIRLKEMEDFANERNRRYFAQKKYEKKKSDQFKIKAKLTKEGYNEIASIKKSSSQLES